MSTTKYDHLPEQEKHAALAREEAAIKAEALRYHDKHRMTPAKVAKLTIRHVVLALLAADLYGDPEKLRAIQADHRAYRGY